MTLDELIAWCEPGRKDRPDQTPTTWQEITDALRELRKRQQADEDMRYQMRTRD
jgi:hypothetical protein